MTLQFLSLGLFILLAAMFSAAETALTALSKAKVLEMVEAGVRGSKRLLHLKEMPRQVLTAVLVGNTFVNVASRTLATSLAQTFLKQHNVTAGLALFTAAVTGIVTFLILVFGEITPKTFALKNSESVALVLTPFVQAVMIAIRPVVVGLNLLTGWIIRLFGGQTPELGSLLTEDEIKMWINLGEEQGVIHSDEARMIEQVFDFNDQVVREVMTPLLDIVSVEHDATVQAAIDVFVKAGHSRLPVTKGGQNNLQGILYAKDVLRLPDAEKNQTVDRFMREALFVPESKPLDQTLKIMKTSRMHMVLVVDEYGSTIGLVTLEDLLEEIVGEIADEHDMGSQHDFSTLGTGHYRVLAKMNVADLSEKLGVTLPESEAYDSIGGYLIHRCGHIPKRGEVFEMGHLKLKVTDATKHRVISLEVNLDETHDANRH